MSASILTTEPIEIIAGDTTQWKASEADYSADDGWILKYSFVLGTDRHEITAETDPDNDDGFLATIAASVSKKWKPGRYAWSGYVEKEGERYTIARGFADVLENFALAPEKSHDRKMLENLQAIAEGRTVMHQDIESSNINGQAITRLPAAELQRLLMLYTCRVKAEDERRAGGGTRILQRY